MQKLEIWRWAQYTLVGVIFICLVAFAFYPALGIELPTSKDTHAIVLVLLAFLAYAFGMLLWCVSIHYSRYLLSPIFRLFPKKIQGACDYHDLRMKLLKFEIENIQSEGGKHKFTLNEELSKDIPGYKHLLLEVFRWGSTKEGYLGDKIIYGWQSCTLMLALLGTVSLGLLITVFVLPLSIFTTQWRWVLVQAVKVLLLLMLYWLTGLAFLERNRLFIRDLALSYTLRKHSEAEQADSVGPR